MRQELQKSTCIYPLSVLKTWDHMLSSWRAPSGCSEWLKGLSKVGWQKEQSPFSSEHRFLDAMPNAAHTPDPLLKTTLCGTEGKWSPKISATCQGPRLRKGTQPHPLYAPSRTAPRFPWGQPWKTWRERHHSVNSLCNRLNSLISLTCSQSTKLTHAVSRRFWARADFTRNWEPSEPRLTLEASRF